MKGPELSEIPAPVVPRLPDEAACSVQTDKRRSARINLIDFIDKAWPEIAAQFLPHVPEDRVAE